MENRVGLAKKVAAIFQRSRYESGKSQEYMAMGIGVSKKTVQNWENGTSVPSILQAEAWFRLLDINPLQFYLEAMLPQDHGLQREDEEDIDEELRERISQLPLQAKQVLLYLFNGQHGSSPYGILQMLAAHLQVPLKDRVLGANVVMQCYEMESQLGNLVHPEAVQPDMEFLKDCICTGKHSVEKNDRTYYPEKQDEE